MTIVDQGQESWLLIIDLNWDRLFYLATVFGALGAGAAVGSLLT